METTEDTFDALQTLIHEHGPSEAQRILRRERRAARAREESRSKRRANHEESSAVQP